MRKSLAFISQVCQAEGAPSCAKCRDFLDGAGFRRQLKEKYVTPVGGIDFFCPKSMPWTNQPIKGIEAPLPTPHLGHPFQATHQHTSFESSSEIWADIHTKKDPNQKWLDDEILPQVARLGGCACRRNFDLILAQYPPDFSSTEAFFDRSWLWHDLVSAGIPGKARITLEEARVFWQNKRLEQ